MNTTPKKRRWWRYLLLSFLALLLLGLGVGGYYLYGWQYRLGGLDFHESWPPEERAELTAFDEYLRGEKLLQACKQWKINACKFLAEVNDTNYEEPGFFAGLWREVEVRHEARQLVSPLTDYIERLTRTGDARLLAENEQTASLCALRWGRVELAKMLVLRGSDPNHCEAGEDMMGYNTLSMAISSMWVWPLEKMDFPARIELCDWLLAHGANLNAPSLGCQNSVLACQTAGLLDDEQRGDMLVWAIERGLSLDPLPHPRSRQWVPAHILLYLNGTLPCIKQLVEQGRLDVNDTRGEHTPLEELCSAISKAKKHEEELLEKLRYLLAQGAKATPRCVELLYEGRFYEADIPQIRAALRLLLEQGCDASQELQDRWPELLTQ